jgi:adenylate kinase
VVRVVMIGPPGAGKGTQARLLGERFGVPQISTGDMLREAQRAGTSLGREAQRYMDDGKLVPDEIVIGLVEQRLGADDARRGFILDGFPRTVAQARWLDGYLQGKAFEKQGNTPLLPLVINIAVGYNQLLQRLTGRRSCPTCGRIYNVYFSPPRVADLCDIDGHKLITRRDDCEEVISARLQEYERLTLPLVEFYRAQGQLREVNGEQGMDAVSAETLKIIDGHRL